MGEVYRARDTRLGRDVAIKILPRELAASDELRQRFEREARTISKLNHSGICAIYDVGRAPGEAGSGDVPFLVMELIEGETLAAQLARGRMPLERVVRIGAEMAAALAAAHARGIVHRDLKPSNVMLTKSGVKLLDFGLARAFATDQGSMAQTVTQGITVDEERALIGTVPYMAPEQLEGKTVDSRADLFALGAVLYEMIAGVRAFPGESQAAVMGAILHRDPPSASALRPECPPALAALVRRCLARDADARWSSAHDLDIQLNDLGAAGAGEGAPAARTAMPRWAWGAVVVALAVAAFALLKHESPPGAASSPIQFSISPPPGRSFPSAFEGQNLAVSPDGSRIALLVGDADGSHRSIVVRDLSSAELREVPGTEGANSLMWSPDGKALAFFAGKSLKRVALDGSSPVPICETPEGGGKSGTWGLEGDILFSPVQGGGIYRVASSGGSPIPLITAKGQSGVLGVSWPWYLPDGEHFLYGAALSPEEGVIKLAARGGSSKTLFSGRSMVQFTAPDMLLFARDGVLYGQHFDWRAGRLRGGPFAVADSVPYFLSTGSAEFATSAGGTLVLQRHEDVSRPYWFDRAGHVLGAAAGPGNYLDVALSPDGRTLLFSRTWPGIGTFDIWSLDLARGVESRLTTGRASEFAPIWMPGGRSIIHSAQVDPLPQMFLRDLESGAEKRIRPTNGFQLPMGVTPDGKSLVYSERTERSAFTLQSMRLDDNSPSVPLLPADIHSIGVTLSPDGRTLAMTTDEAGAPDLYVMPFPGPGPRVRVTNHGATQPCWSRDGRELFYIEPGSGLMAVTVTHASGLTVGPPVRLIDSAITGRWLGYDVAPDGRRFIAIVSEVNADQMPLTVIVNWPARISQK
jgi:serine/threonine protein kinase